MPNLLVIKLGALGDMVQVTPAFFLLKERYPKHSLMLLTKPAYASFAKHLNVFDYIIEDPRRPFWHPACWRVLWQLRAGNFDTVYDLQNVDRTRFYRRFFAKGTKVYFGDKKIHPHSQDRLRLLFGLAEEDWPELDLRAYQEPFDLSLEEKYALLIPGCSANHPEKRWPSKYYRDVAQELYRQGITPVIIGGPEENFSEITHELPYIVDLTGKTTPFQIVTLASQAEFALGNDTGPMFLAAAGKCRTFCIYGLKNPPTIGGHKGKNHTILYHEDLEKLSVDKVLSKIFG